MTNSFSKKALFVLRTPNLHLLISKEIVNHEEPLFSKGTLEVATSIKSSSHFLGTVRDDSNSSSNNNNNKKPPDIAPPSAAGG